MENKVGHYDRQIWLVFSVGVALSLWILYTLWTKDIKDNLVKFGMIYIGFVILTYSTLNIEGLGQRKWVEGEMQEKTDKQEKLEKKLTSISVAYIVEFFILLPLFIFYIISVGKFIIYPWNSIIISSMILILLIVIINWARGILFRNLWKRKSKSWGILIMFLSLFLSFFLLLSLLFSQILK